jgi:hypothetical protein
LGAARQRDRQDLRATLALSSHAEGGLTERDFQLAARILELDQPTQPAGLTDRRLKMSWLARRNRNQFTG